jgi:hypothetical protein
VPLVTNTTLAPASRASARSRSWRRVNIASPSGGSGGYFDGAAGVAGVAAGDGAGGRRTSGRGSTGHPRSARRDGREHGQPAEQLASIESVRHAAHPTPAALRRDHRRPEPARFA